MPLRPGKYGFGPEVGTLSVRTKKGGAASKAGHNLLIEVESWNATLEVGEGGRPSTLLLTANARTLRVREGTGGAFTLGDEEKSAIAQTIDEEVLLGRAIVFRSKSVDVAPGGERAHVSGELSIVGASRPVEFDLTAEDARLTGAAQLKQTDWGITPYTALFGTLKVQDEIEVAIEAELPQ